MMVFILSQILQNIRYHKVSFNKIYKTLNIQINFSKQYNLMSRTLDSGYLPEFGFWLSVYEQ